ncbi:hypothetical protein DMENIID0001_168760 [Sergentomyia squamirostris]
MAFFKITETAMGEIKELVKKKICRRDVEDLCQREDKIEEIRSKNSGLAVLLEGAMTPRNCAEAYEVLGLNIYNWKDIRAWREGPTRNLSHQKLIKWKMAFFKITETAMGEIKELVKKKICRRDVEDLCQREDKIEEIRSKNSGLAVLLEGAMTPRNCAEAYEVLGLNIYNWKDIRAWREGPTRNLSHQKLIKCSAWTDCSTARRTDSR